MGGELNTKKPEFRNRNSGVRKIRRRPTLPLSLPSSTIGAKELNFRVRDGNGCILFAIATGNLRTDDWCLVFSVLFPFKHQTLPTI